jgi:hypothetical protein
VAGRSENAAMRIVFTAYLLLIAVGLAYAIAIGIANPS